MTIRAVLFDWSGTLFHDTVPLPQLIVQAATQVGRPMSVDDAQQLVARAGEALRSDPVVIAAARDRDRSAAAHRHADRVLFQAAGISDEELIDAIYGAFLARGMHPYPDTASTLRELRRLAVPVAVVSNCGWDIRRNFAEHGLDSEVDAFALSFEHGAVKPEPLLFRLACDLLQVEPESALMVGDDPATDGGAARLGITTLILPKVPPGARRGLDLAIRLVSGPAA